jgi:uncharacterized protein YijF (DUF1287 family)
LKEVVMAGAMRSPKSSRAGRKLRYNMDDLLKEKNVCSHVVACASAGVSAQAERQGLPGQ